MVPKKCLREGFNFWAKCVRAKMYPPTKTKLITLAATNNQALSELNKYGSQTESSEIVAKKNIPICTAGFINQCRKVSLNTINPATTTITGQLIENSPASQ